jgi:hypothetical protein
MKKRMVVMCALISVCILNGMEENLVSKKQKNEIPEYHPSHHVPPTIENLPEYLAAKKRLEEKSQGKAIHPTVRDLLFP